MLRRAIVLVITTTILGACGGGDDTPAPAAGTDETPMTKESVAEAPGEETVPLKDAKKGELISLPFYPGAGRYGGTADLRGQKAFSMEVAVIKRIRSFSPSVLIGSPGQQVKLTFLKEKDVGLPGAAIHDFRIGDSPEFSIDHEIVGEQWKAKKGTNFTITFPEEGSVAFYCSYHLRIDMAGMLVVKDSM